MWGCFQPNPAVRLIVSVGEKKRSRAVLDSPGRSFARRLVLGNPRVHSCRSVFHIFSMDVLFVTDVLNHWISRVESTAAKNLILRPA